jgi:hypothetical protein
MNFTSLSNAEPLHDTQAVTRIKTGIAKAIELIDANIINGINCFDSFTSLRGLAQPRSTYISPTEDGPCVAFANGPKTMQVIYLVTT